MNMLKLLKPLVLPRMSADSCITSKVFSKIILAIVLSFGSLSANAGYIFTPLGAIGGSTSEALSINSSGQVVGDSTQSDLSLRATLWNNGTITDLNAPSSSTSQAISINSSGQVVGISTPIHATLWNNGAITDLGTLGGSTSVAFSINSSGKVVGDSDTLSSSIHATLWNNGAITDLGTLGGSNSSASYINSSGQIVGYSSTQGDLSSHATLWNNGTITDLGTLGGSTSQALSINSSGQIVGYSSTQGDLSFHATLWNNGTITDLGTLGGSTSFARAINSSGQIVGLSSTPGNLSSHATLWNNGTITDLNSLLNSNDANAGWVLIRAVGINDSGSIVGTATNSLLGVSSQAFLLTIPTTITSPKTTSWEGQSPIDFNSANVISAPNNAAIQYHYAAQAVTLKNTADATIGRQWGSLAATPVNANSYVTVGGDKYVLKEFHFHTASEHTVNGVHNPMEMHLVHLKVHDNGKPYCYGEPGSLLVISALINDGGSKKNAELDKIFGLPSLASLADGATYSGAISPINIQKVLPSNGAAYRYHGSLTEPTNVSCDASVYANTNYNSTAVEQLADHRFGNDGSFPEAVSWVVLSTPITLSTAQITLFKTLFPTGGNTPNGNSRPTQNQDHTQPAIVRNTDRKVLLIK